MKSDLVYSTVHGRLCPGCEKPSTQCMCSKKKNSLPKGDGRVRVGRETKGRKGNGITLITGLPLNPDDLNDLAKELKRFCGTGGTVKAADIELQGDHRDKVVNELIKRGYDAKRSGG